MPSGTRTFAVYLLTNSSGSVIYTGVTNDLARRVAEHREGRIPGFTSRYRVLQLMYYEWFEDVQSAIAREKQIKAGSRAKKLRLIRQFNPEGKDLYDQIRL